MAGGSVGTLSNHPLHDHRPQTQAWDVLGELEFRHRGLIGPQALWQDMQAHPQVANHVLNWLLDKYVGLCVLCAVVVVG